MAPVEGVPEHGPVGQGEESFGEGGRGGGEGVEGETRTAEDEGLEAGGGECCVGHGCKSALYNGSVASGCAFRIWVVLAFGCLVGLGNGWVGDVLILIGSVVGLLRLLL